MTAQTDLQPDDRLPIGGSALQCRLAEAAIELFGSRGAPATSVREITAACGLSPGALYNHFASKDELLYVLVRDIHLQFDAGMAATLASARPGPGRAARRYRPLPCCPHGQEQEEIPGR